MYESTKKYREYKLHQKVRIIDTNLEGYIDTITPDRRYVVRIQQIYQWCCWFEIEPIDAPKKENHYPKMNKFDYL